MDAIKYASNNGIRIVNMSLGGDGTPSNDMICNAITAAKIKGTISIVAAGNENMDTSTKVPAGCADAITVGAVDSTLTKASFSNYGAKVDVAAPGVNIYSSYLNNGYATMNGTSMATPFVVGLTAAILSYNPSLGFDQVKTILKDPANTLAVTSNVNIGRFISMTKVMTALGAKNDTLLDIVTPPPVVTNPPVVSVPPTLTLAATKVSTNVYKITATASSSGATIVNYSFYNGTSLLSSGTTNTFQITITANTTITTKITDSK